MNRKSLKFIIMLVILGFIFTSGSICDEPSSISDESDTIDFFEDFESYDTGTYPDTYWKTMFGGISAEISSEQYVSPTKSFKLSASWNWSRSDYILINYVDKFYYEASLYVDQKAAALGFSIPRGDYNPTYNMIRFQHDKNIYFKGKKNYMIQPFSYKRWYTVRVYIDYAELTADVYIDDVKKGENLEIYPYLFYDEKWGDVKLNRFTLHIPNFDSGEAVAYFDDIILEGVREHEDLFPQVKLLINDGDMKTAETNVVLTIISDNATHMRLRNDGEDWTDWLTYTSHMNWSVRYLEGERTVSVEVKNRQGRMAFAEDSITFEKSGSVDETPPSDGSTWKHTALNMRNYPSFIIAFLVIGICFYIVLKRKPKRIDKEVDTFQVALLGSSLISLLISELLIIYSLFFFTITSPEYKEYAKILQGMLNIEYDVHAAIVYFFVFFILPLIVSLLLWVVMPSLIRLWYSFEPLPPPYHYVYDLVQNIASKMGVPPPAILYTPKDIVNCFNLGKREGDSTLIISNWLISNLTPDELEAVLAHEIAHTKNRDVTLMAYFNATRWVLLFTSVFILSNVFFKFLIYGPIYLQNLLSPGVWIPVAAVVIYFLLFAGILWFSKLREFTADARASLFVDKENLIRALYKFAAVRQTVIELLKRPFRVFSCLMISDNRPVGSIFSTHPPIFKRKAMLDKGKYIIDYKKPPTLRECFTIALGIFVFLQLIGFIFGALVLNITGELPGMSALFLGSIIVATLLILYYGHLSLKYLGLIILLGTFIHLIVFFVLSVPVLLGSRYFLFPGVELSPSTQRNIFIYTADLLRDFPEFVKMFLLIDIGLSSITEFLTTAFLKYARKIYKRRNIISKKSG